jgi:hypothetical protein
MLMMTFWMFLAGAAGKRVAPTLWQILGLGAGSVSVAVPVGGFVGAVAGALLGLISNPRLLVLLMAVLSSSAAGSTAGKVAWGESLGRRGYSSNGEIAILSRHYR